jgi:hypothetical protein
MIATGIEGTLPKMARWNISFTASIQTAPIQIVKTIATASLAATRFVGERLTRANPRTARKGRPRSRRE